MHTEPWEGRGWDVLMALRMGNKHHAPLENGLALLAPVGSPGEGLGQPTPWTSVPEAGPGLEEMRQEGNMGCEQDK